jgi:hypothetical protein
VTLPTNLGYPLIAIADLHGQLEQLERLITKLEKFSEWDDCALVFLGDYVDRGEDVPGTIDKVLELLNRPPGGSAMHRKCWDRSTLNPVAGTKTDSLWKPEYPVWIGADRALSKSPLAYPGKIQVTGHEVVSEPDVNPIRIRLDTSGGVGYLTACLLRSPDASPEFISSKY